MASASGIKGNESAVVIVSGTLFILCLSLAIVVGIISWLRKRASVDWWRERCGCLGGNGGGPMPSFNSTFGTKPEASTTCQSNDFDSIHKTDERGLDNPSFEPQRMEIHGVTSQSTEQEIPQINVTRAPSDYYSIQRDIRNSSRFKSRHLPGDRHGLHVTTAEFERQKVVSKPSITSDYVSDMESESGHVFTRIPTGGRYSSRQLGEKKRHRRKPHGKTGARYSHGKNRKHGSASLTNLTRIDLGRPITRRHSLAAEYQNEGQVVLDPRRPIPPTRNKRQRSASDAHLIPSDRNLVATSSQPLSVTSHPLQSSPFNDNSSLGLNRAATTGDRLGEVPQKSNSLNPLPTKSTGLVRSETILEVPIYIKPDRPSSARIELHEAEIKRHHRASRTGKGTRTKPPRTRARKERNVAKRARAGESASGSDWQYGYGSLPADLGKIKENVLRQIGMTTESLLGSLENLDFEKLCRQVPISDDQHQASPRKPVADGEMPGHEQEMLKNTYKLEEFGIVTTDL